MHQVGPPCQRIEQLAVDRINLIPDIVEVHKFFVKSEALRQVKQRR